MIAVALFLTYAGVVLCYVASPQTPVASPAAFGQRVLRLGGWAAMAASLVLLAVALHGTAGVLVGLAALMLAASVVVIAAPLVPRFVPASAGLMLIVTLIALLGS